MLEVTLEDTDGARHRDSGMEAAHQAYESRGVVGYAPAFPGVAQVGCSS